MSLTNPTINAFAIYKIVAITDGRVVATMHGDGKSEHGLELAFEQKNGDSQNFGYATDCRHDRLLYKQVGVKFKEETAAQGHEAGFGL